MAMTNVRRVVLVSTLLIVGSEGLAQRALIRLDCGKCDGEQRARSMVLVNEGGKCLDVHAPDLRKDGGLVQVYECKETEGEYWSWNGNALRNGGGKCLQGDREPTATHRGLVQVWSCNRSVQQQWRMQNGALVHQGTGLCLDVDRGTMNQDRGHVQLWTCAPGAAPQVWQFASFQDR